MAKSTKVLLLLTSVLIVSNFLIWQAALSSENVNGNELKVYFLDIGQGDATFIEAPNGNQILIDGGRTDNKVLRELGEVMNPFDKEIDVVIATHPDADHVGGLPEVFSRYKVENYIDSGNQTKDTQIFKVLTQKVQEKTNEGMNYLIAKHGQRFTLDKEKEIYIDILYPDKDVRYVESNDASIVIKLSYKNNCFIMSGDASRNIERHVAGLEKNNLDCDVLKTGHHGSRTSTSAEWVGFISPKYAVISVGKNNTYGHPNKETLDTLKRFNAEIYRTDEEGRIEINSDGKQVYLK
ncbi:MAG: ComEC/Rec2 family competence protein [Patescibacteria group bacterium]